MIKRLVAVGVLLLASGKTVAADTGLDLSAIASASNGLNISIDEHNIDSDRSFSVTAYEVVDVPPASSHVSPRLPSVLQSWFHAEKRHIAISTFV